MTNTDLGGTFRLTPEHDVHRMGYGAMQLAGPHVFGPPKDRAAAVAVLRTALDLGIDHIDTSDFYGPYITNEIIREALHPYPDDLTIVTKVGAFRDEQGGWPPARSPQDLRKAVEENLQHLGLDALDVVNFRIGGVDAPNPDESVTEGFAALADMQREGLIKHLGLSTVTSAQLAEARTIAPVVCVQNLYNVARRDDDALVDELAAAGIAFVPYFPLGGFSPVQGRELDAVAERLGATPLAVALAWLLHRSPNILLIPGTSSVQHLRDNIAAADLQLPDDALAELDTIGVS